VNAAVAVKALGSVAGQHDAEIEVSVGPGVAAERFSSPVVAKAERRS